MARAMREGSPVRVAAGLTAAAGIAALGALILGEYSFTGLTVLGAGAALGLFTAEVARATTGRASTWLAAGCAVVAGGAMLWSAWIATGHNLSFLGPEGWAAVAVAAVVAGFRAWWTRPARDSPQPEPEPEA
jgi:phosphatidylserine synthase